MRKRCVYILIFLLVASFFTISQAAAIDARNLSAKEKRELAKQVKKKLNGMSWNIELTLMGQKKQTKMKDVISFAESRVASERLVNDGFVGTNFTVSIKGKDVIVWETMQSEEKKGIAFWRGEIRGGTMQGVLSRHLADKQVKDYSFVSLDEQEEITLEGMAAGIKETVVEKVGKVIEKVKKARKEEPAPPKTETVVETSEPETEKPASTEKIPEKKEEPQKKKKRGWWQ